MALISEMIEGYADMTAEEKLSALEALEMPKADDSEAKKWKKQYDSVAHELAEKKKENSALQEQINTRLTDDEKAQREKEEQLKELIAERDLLKREKAISDTAAQYIALGYDKELAISTANALYDGDIETAVKNAESFKTTFEQTIREGIVKGNPTPTSKGSSTKTMTKADIMAIKDTAKRQKAIEENMELFE